MTPNTPALARNSERRGFIGGSDVRIIMGDKVAYPVRGPVFLCCRFSQAHSRPSTVLVDEFDASCFKSTPDRKIVCCCQSGLGFLQLSDVWWRHFLNTNPRADGFFRYLNRWPMSASADSPSWSGLNSRSGVTVLFLSFFFSVALAVLPWIRFTATEDFDAPARSVEPAVATLVSRTPG